MNCTFSQFVRLILVFLFGPKNSKSFSEKSLQVSLSELRICKRNLPSAQKSKNTAFWLILA